MEGTSEGSTTGQGKQRRVKEKRELVSDQELVENGSEMDLLFKGKEDAELPKRIDENIERLRKWAVQRGSKKEPVLPANVEKITDDISLKDENLFYRLTEDAPDPYMLWAIDTDNDVGAHESSPDGLILRVMHDKEISATVLDIRQPIDGSGLEIGTTEIRGKFATGAERQTVNFPPRKLSRLSGFELRNADVFLRSAVEALIYQPRRAQHSSPTFRAIDVKPTSGTSQRETGNTQ